MPRASLSETSDTARLDSELLMAEALHIDRDKLILSPPDREVPERFWDMVERREGGRAGRLHHRPPRLLEHRAARRPRRARAAPGLRSADRFGDRAFRGHATGRSGSSTSAPARERCCSPRSTSGRTRRASASTSRAGRCPMPRPTPAGSGSKAGSKLDAGQLGRGAGRKIRPRSCATRPISPTARSSARASREYEPDEALFAGKEGLDAYRALAPAAAAPA